MRTAAPSQVNASARSPNNRKPTRTDPGICTYWNGVTILPGANLNTNAKK